MSTPAPSQNRESDHVIPDGCRDGCEHETLRADGPPVEDRFKPLRHRAFQAYVWMVAAPLMVLANRGVNGGSMSLSVSVVFVVAAVLNVISYCLEAVAL